MLIGQRRLGALTFVYCDSDRRHTSEEIRLAEEIGHRTALTVENAKLYNQLQESDRRKDEFLATLAHELRNPLAPIRNGLQILELAGDQRETLDDVRQMMVRQIGQMVRLVDDLLDISRISRGKIELHLQRLEVKAVIQLALETSRPLIDEAQHTLTISMPAQALYVTADLTRLAQVVSNLLNNSAKYTPEGGHIWLTVQEEEDQLAIRVRDNGIGIPSVNLPEIFGMFTQLGRASTRVAGGLGIGLALVQRLVQMHGGSVEATSSGEGQGSEFIVRLMIANDSSAAGAAEEQDHSTQIATPRIRRILVVDDNKDSAETLGMMLRLTGNVVVVANDGPSALAQASVFRPHIVLLDIGLPGITGYDVARQLREMPYMRNALLIAQTGWGQDVDRRLSAEAGFNHHLVKPIEPKILEELLAEFKTEDESTRRGA